MKIEPVDNKEWWNFRSKKIFQKTTQTAYGKRIQGASRGYNYDVYVEEVGKNIFYKLYMVFKNDKWVKSVLKYFSENKMYKAIRSNNK